MRLAALSPKLHQKKKGKSREEGRQPPGAAPRHPNFKTTELSSTARPAAHPASTSPSASAAPRPAATQARVTPASSRKTPLVSE